MFPVSAKVRTHSVVLAQNIQVADMPSLKLISATDTQYSATVLKSMNEQRNHGLFCDITIVIQDKKFRAHKTILSASSTYFHQLFTVAGQVIELNFIRAEIFEEILNYVYSSKIVRVRSDMLEELINAGKILGVKFLANLGSPLSHVKGLPGLSKEPENKNETPAEVMPIITESFSISAEEFNQTSKAAENDEDSDGDVMFVSQTKAHAANQNTDSCEIIDVEKAGAENVAEVKIIESNHAAAKHKDKPTASLKTQAAKSPVSVLLSPVFRTAALCTAQTPAPITFLPLLEFPQEVLPQHQPGRAVSPPSPPVPPSPPKTATSWESTKNKSLLQLRRGIPK
ncbi:unnamed protein product [Pleuronectes platessa]|uniref:BTB domain-containing protein n=1 Tax=Pleuronectes platessa TaxID=8262 RepID=A0A9N7VSW9_PLEPL|nr:unnamed protein product [Pleuronectes platessa]